MKKGTSAGILLIGAIASLYLIGKGGAIGGAGAEKVGAILGSPGAIVGGIPSAGTGSQKQIAALTGYLAPGGKVGRQVEVTPQVAAQIPKKKASFAVQKAPAPYLPEAVSQPYITKTGEYVAPTFEGVGGKIIGGRYTPPTGLYPSKTQAGLTAKGLATQKKVATRSTGRAPSRTQTGLTAKGLATQKKATARKKTPTSGYAAALARSG